jgi:hypothetical protein
MRHITQITMIDRFFGIRQDRLAVVVTGTVRLGHSVLERLRKHLGALHAPYRPNNPQPYAGYRDNMCRGSWRSNGAQVMESSLFHACFAAATFAVARAGQAKRSPWFGMMQLATIPARAGKQSGLRRR